MPHASPGRPRVLATLAIFATIGLSAGMARASPQEVVRELVGLTDERIERFRTALQDFLSDGGAGVDVLALESSWTTSYETLSRDASIVVPLGGRDLVFEEELLVLGREEEYRDDARRSVERALKGSAPDVDVGLPRGPRFGWDHGPTFGWRVGPARASVGEFGWRLRVDRSLRRASGSPWQASAWVGEDDGDVRAGFLIGRSLLSARAPRR